MKKRYKVLIIIASVVVLLVVAGIIAFPTIQKNLETLKTMEIRNVDLMQIADGTYTGSYSMFPVSAEVSVSVSGHAITEIKLIKHVNGQGSAAESIPAEVVAKQTLGVDTVSGATYSSKVILKAIENALTEQG